jgi:hypothetical protein
MMHGHEKSDPAVVAVKPANKVAPHCGAVRGGVSRCGAGGAKGGDQGECGPTKHAPDTEPDKRDTGRWFAYGNLLPFGPEVGAVCGKAARTVLCGGREVTRVPTASGVCCNAWVRWHLASFAAVHKISTRSEALRT